MIRKSPSFVTSDGQPHATLELAQRAELTALLHGGREAFPLTDEQSGELASLIHDNREAIIAILCASGRKPRAVKAKGNGVKKRRGKVTDKTEALIA